MHSQPIPNASLTFYARVRERWTAGLRCPSDAAFAFGISLIWLLFYNVRFWELVIGAMWRPTFTSVLFLISLFVLTLSLQAVLLLIWPTRRLMRTAASIMFIIAALGAYFCSEYGAVMNKEMMRNVMQTDTAETGALMTADLWLHLVLMGFLPAFLVWRVRFPEMTWKKQLSRRALTIGAALAISVVALFASSANYASFFREHKPVRFTLSPGAEVISMTSLLAGKHAQASTALIDPSGVEKHTAAVTAKPLVLFLVIGETARAANFQLGGYQRDTNPELKQVAGLTYFSKATSCGTSTAISVPCLFSHLPRAGFKVDEAAQYTNLLDSLKDAGFDIEWRDNNSGCKGVCARVATIDYNDSTNTELCRDRNCFDEVMLTDLPERLRQIQHNTVIVFHQKGSHGPAYYERYPAAFEKFTPACRTNQLQHCTEQQIANAYDNTIAYTDHVLAKQIAMLQAADAQVDGMLLYVSDHGESLGENSIYLHGMPYAFAPAAQKEVPLLMWASPGYVQRARLEPKCLQAEAATAVSHDFIYHTVLGAAEIRNQVYDPHLDLISGCKRAGGAE